MAFKINTKGLADALRTMQYFMMQNKMSEMSNARYMNVLSEQDRMMRERQAQAEVTAHKGRVENYLIGRQEAIFKGFMDAADDEGIKGLRRRAEVARVAGQTDQADLYDEQASKQIEDLINASVQAQTGEPLDVNQFRSLATGGGLDKMIDVMKEGGINRRAAAELPVTKQQAATSAGRLKREQEKATGEGAAIGGMTQKEYYDRMHDKIEGTKKVLFGIKKSLDAGDDLSDILDVVELKKMMGGKVGQQNLLAKIAELNKYDSLAMKTRLKPGVEGWLDKFVDFTRPESQPGAMELEQETQKAIEAEKPRAPATAPMTTAPAQAIPAEVQAYMVRHPELSLEFVMQKYREYLASIGRK